jgi:hypothetical protein
MRLSHRYRFIFFSNPKTGSESVRLLLDAYSDIKGVPYLQRTPANPFYSHITPRETRDIFETYGWDFESYFKLTFVRNPWARLVSLYEMIYGNKSASVIDGVVNFGARLFSTEPRHPSTAGFCSWLRTVKSNGVGAGGAEHERWRRYGSYGIDAYVSDENGKWLVDKVIRLEDIARDLIPVLEQIGLPEAGRLTIPRINVRRHADYKRYYDDGSIAWVAENYRDDIARFDYRFGD